jgi:hypothetical protein
MKAECGMRDGVTMVTNILALHGERQGNHSRAICRQSFEDA